MLQAKYFPQDTLFTNSQPSRRSHIWTAISIRANLLREGMHWYIGDGQTIRIWQDPWLPNDTLRSYIERPLLPHEDDRRVRELWLHHDWSLKSLNLPLPPQIHSLIQGIPVPRFAQLSDAYLWPHNKGTCSMKSASTFLYHQHQVPWNKAIWKSLWSLPCPKKIQVFLWKALRNCLPTKTFLAFGRQHVDSLCPRCQSPETTIHILQDCPWAREIWRQALGILPLSFFALPLQDWLQSNATSKRATLPHLIPSNVFFLFTCCKLWLAHNERIFNHQSITQHSLLYSSVQAATEFHFLAGTVHQTPTRIPQTIRWHPPPHLPSLNLTRMAVH